MILNKNNNKLFSLAIFIMLILFASFHILTWFFITSKSALVNPKIYKGDLGRNIYKTDSLVPRRSREPVAYVTLPKQHIKARDWNKSMNVDLITIGDSFSNSDTQGLNPYYQDYIATYDNINVLNLPRKLNTTNNFFETIIKYINNGLIDEINPKYILIESVERSAIDRFAKNFDFNLVDDKSKIIKSFKEQKEVVLSKKLHFHIINDKNVKAFKNNFLFQFEKTKYGLFNDTHVVKMDRDFFTTVDHNSLLYYAGDLVNIKKASDKNMKKLNDNFNKLATILAKKGIKLYFMPAIDKYNLYSPYVVNNKYPESLFFEKLEKLPKNYIFINTKKILRMQLTKGVKDIFYSDDTHWSYKASEAIFKHNLFKIKI